MTDEMKNKNPHNLANNEIMLGRKDFFCIPFDSEIKLEDMKQALGEKYSRTEIDYAFRKYHDTLPYIYSIINIFRRHNEVIIKARPSDVDMAKVIISLFEDAFNIKQPYGSSGESIKDIHNKERIKFVIVKKLI